MALCRTPWFLSPRPVAQPRFRLICFPHAGGGASAFTGWVALLARAQVEVTAVQYPGRETRLGEEPVERFDAIASAVAELIARSHHDVPYAILGHSMGAMLGFETLRRIEQAGTRLPERLFLSGRRAPHLVVKPRSFDGLEDAAVLDYVSNLYGGIHPEVLQHAEMRSIVVRTLRADLTLLRHYDYAGSLPASAVPFTALGGRSDSGAEAAMLQEWQSYTSGGFALTMFEGDHFFLFQQPQPVLATVLDELRTPA